MPQYPENFAGQHADSKKPSTGKRPGKAKLSVVPDQPQPAPFPPSLRPAAQTIWAVLTNESIHSREARSQMALSVLDGLPNLSPDDRRLIWNAVTTELTNPTPSPPTSTNFGSRPSTDSDATSPQKKSSNTSPPAPEPIPWVQPPDFNWINPQDVPAFIQDTTRRMLVLLNQELSNMAELQQELEKEGKAEHAMMVEKKLTVLNLMRLECIEINLSSLPPEADDLLVVDNRLTDQHGRPL